MVGFVVGVANALNLCATTQARLSVTAVNRHVLAKSGNFLGERRPRLRRAAGPDQGFERGVEERFPVVRREFVRERDWRHFCRVQDFVGVRVANAAHDARIGEGSLHGAVLGGESGAKRGEIASKNFDAARVDGAQALFAHEEMQGRTALCTGFGEHKRAIGKIERGEILPARQLRFARAPVQAARDHQVQYQPEAAIDANGDSLADSPQFAHRAAVRTCLWWQHGAKQKRARESNPFDRLADDSGFKRGEIGGDVRQLGHAYELAGRDSSFATPVWQQHFGNISLTTRFGGVFARMCGPSRIGSAEQYCY